MSFEEYAQANYKRLEGQTRELVEDAFEAGQQSKQDEIDELQKRINEALNVFKSDLSEIGKFDTIHKILKGEQK